MIIMNCSVYITRMESQIPRKQKTVMSKFDDKTVDLQVKNNLKQDKGRNDLSDSKFTCVEGEQNNQRSTKHVMIKGLISDLDLI